jgi:hypothetical protein
LPGTAQIGDFLDVKVTHQRQHPAHRLLGIDDATSERYRHAVQDGYCGIKPGWCRIGLHWAMDDAEVDYVSKTDQDFIKDIEEREKAGTPGVLQTMKAALVFQIKDRVGVDTIHRREHEFTTRAMHRWREEDGIEILGNPDPDRRVGIISFNVRSPDGKYLHHKFVTALLNDLFGIQSRAGCSCAGPYGHRLLGIDRPTSELYRDWVRKGFQGIKPGWCRVGFHYSMDDLDAGFIVDSVEFLAMHGYRFLPLYQFDVESGEWKHREYQESHVPFSLEAALEARGCDETALPPEERARLYRAYLDEARSWAERLEGPSDEPEAPGEGRFGELTFFNVG